MKITFKQFMVPNFGKRLAFMLPAVILMGVFVSLLLEVNWGTDPASFMNQNISHTIGLSFGTTEVIVYGLMLIFTFIFGPQMFGFGTIDNIVLIGYIAEFCRCFGQDEDAVLQSPFTVITPDSKNPYKQMYVAN